MADRGLIRPVLSAARRWNPIPAAPLRQVTLTFASFARPNWKKRYNAPVIDMAELDHYLARRSAEPGIADAVLPRNTGTRRTDSKKALLKTIEDGVDDW
jgi:hypothetical protein